MNQFQPQSQSQSWVSVTPPNEDEVNLDKAPWDKEFYENPETTIIDQLKCRVKVYEANNVCYFHIMNPNLKYGKDANMSRLMFTLLEAESMVKFWKPIMKSLATLKQGKLLPCFGNSIVAAEMKRQDPGFWDSAPYCMILNSIRVRVTQPTHHFNPCFTLHCPGKGDKLGNFICIYKDTMVKFLDYLDHNVQLMKNKN